MRTWRRWVVLAGLTSVLACRTDPADDAAARRCVDLLTRGDPAGAEFLEPNSVLARVGWDSLARRMRRTLPQGTTDSLLLRVTEEGRDSSGRYRKLTYWLFRSDTLAQVSVWLVNSDGRLFVSTVKVGPPTADGT